MSRHCSFRFVFLSVAVLGCGAIAYIELSQRRLEPSFQGHSASYWLRELVAGRGDPSCFQALEAFRQMGTNADPVLATAIEARENPFARKYRLIYYRLPLAIRDLLHQPDEPMVLRAAAVSLLALPAPGRIHIAPTVLDLLEKPDSGLRLAVLQVINDRIADAGQLPFLLMAGDDPDAKVRRGVL